MLRVPKERARALILLGQKTLRKRWMRPDTSPKLTRKALQVRQPFFQLPSQAGPTEEFTSWVNNISGGPTCVTLGVIAVKVKDARGHLVTARALVDEGSDTSLTSLSFFRKLGLKGERR